MKSIILCEGTTDLMFIQYFMEIAYNWVYDNKCKEKFQNAKLIKWFCKGNNRLGIVATGGVSSLPKLIGEIFEYDKIA